MVSHLLKQVLAVLHFQVMDEDSTYKQSSEDATKQKQTQCVSAITSRINALKNSVFWGNFLDAIQKSIMHWLAKDSERKQDTVSGLEIVCYGIGKFSSNSMSLCQLALLVLIKHQYNVSNVFVYDPLLSALEKDVLGCLGMQLVGSNEQGKRTVLKPTLFYMPHCGRAMYNNVVWANWGSGLASVAIIGNSFELYKEQSISLRHIQQSKTVQKSTPNTISCACPHDHDIHKSSLSRTPGALEEVLPFTTELRLLYSDSDAEIFGVGTFNDLSIHTFEFDSTTEYPQRPAELIIDPGTNPEIIS